MRKCVLLGVVCAVSGYSAVELDTFVDAANGALDGTVSLIGAGPQQSQVFRNAVGRSVDGVKSKFNEVMEYVRENMVSLALALECARPECIRILDSNDISDYPEFLSYLNREGKTVKGLRKQANTLVLREQDSMPTGTVLGSIKELYLVGNWSPTGLDIAGCTGLVTLGMFDGGSGLDEDQRNKISSLVKGQKKLETLIVMNWGNAAIAGSAFCGTGSGTNSGSLVAVVIHKATSIGSAAFRYCQKLTTVSIPDAGSIGTTSDSYTTSAFAYCKVLKTVEFPVAQSIGNYAFGYCEALQTVSYPSNASLGYSVFSGCSGYQIILLPPVNP
jgi:hypothetical protein